MGLGKGKEKKKKETVSPEEVQKQTREKTSQQWIPIADIESSVVYRKDDFLVSMLRVQPENIDLFSDREQKRKVEALAEQLNGEKEPIQIFCVGRPVDLNNYLVMLQDKAKMEQDFIRKQILKGYIQHTSQVASSGEIIERRFYLIITKSAKGSKAEQEITSRIYDLQNKLGQAELVASVCKEDEIMDVYSLFANPIEAAFERVEYRMDIPTVMEG